MDWLASRDRAAEGTKASGNPVPIPDTLGIIDDWFPQPR